MTHCYCHLTAEDRATIMMMRATHSIRAIASHLGRASSTVPRELARHPVDPIMGYEASLAGYRARLTRRRPRHRPKLHPDGELFEVVVYLLRKYWSPQQIARTLKRMSPNDPHRQVSHETIYNALYVMPCGRVTASVGHAVVARIDASRFLIWSASICARLRSKTV